MHGSEGLAKVKSFLMDDMGVTNIRFPDTVSLGVKPVSKDQNLVIKLFYEALVESEINNRFVKII